MKAVSGTWNFSGHQATLPHGCDSEAQPEHGCEFAPVAGKNNILIKIFSAAYNFYVAFLFEEPCRRVNEYQKEYIDRPKERSDPGNNVRTGISDFPSRASENAACK